MAKSTLVTLEDYLRVRGMSRAQLAGMCHMSEKTIDRWCSKSVRPYGSKVRKVAAALNIEEKTAEAMVENGQKAKSESGTLRELRYAMAVISYCEEREATSPEDAQLMRKRLTTIRFAAKRVAASIDGCAVEPA